MREKRLRPEKEKGKSGAAILSVVLMFLAGAYLLVSLLKFMDVIGLSDIEVFNTIFISILMQAFPFMLIGVLVSSALNVFVPDQWIVKVFPTKHGLGFLTAMFGGLIFPVCECAIVPVMARLIKKGVAMPIAVTFMLSAPIINPISIIATLYAFPGQPEIAILRVFIGVLTALMIGIVMSSYGDSLPLLADWDDHECGCGHDHGHEACGCAACSEDSPRIKTMLINAGNEFFDVGKYLVLGAAVTSLMQVLIPREAYSGLGANTGVALLIMMAAAFLFSACSTSDAFIGRSFLNRFSMGPVMGFMVFGPMMDIKNLLMLLASFKKGFVIRLSLLIFAVNFLMLRFFIHILF